MAFYPDELSPIDRIRSLGKPSDLSDINLIKNRRQWKSLVLGKKDLGMNNFDTITEEKEEEISSEGSQSNNLSKDATSCLPGNAGAVANKKITFPKPRRYINSRASDKKEEGGGGGLKTLDAAPPTTLTTVTTNKDQEKKKDVANTLAVSKAPLPEIKSILRAKKSRESISSTFEFPEHYAFNETPIETQWNEKNLGNAYSTSGPKSSGEKPSPTKCDLDQPMKYKQEEKKRPLANSKSSNAEAIKQEGKLNKKKATSLPKKGGQSQKAAKDASQASKPSKTTLKGKQKVDKGKSLNMKDVVNVYKNLAYGSKDEIKSFVEKLSFVKDEAEEDKNLLSVMNLKALENKIKNFIKKSSKNQEATISSDKKPKSCKPVKKNRKAHIERLARHKVVKVPAVLNYNTMKSNVRVANVEKTEPKGKSLQAKDKEPWKYVGMESILDKTYFVYPAYPPSVNLKSTGRKAKGGAKKSDIKDDGSPPKEKKEKAEVTTSKFSNPSKSGSKVKQPEVVIRQNFLTKTNPVRSGATWSTNTLNVSRSISNKSISRASATTVCTVEFCPKGSRKAFKTSLVEGPNSTDPSLLVYLHGTKAIHVKSPYSDKQFSRVKFFRKDGRAVPLIKGLNQRVLPKSYKNVSVRNINLPGSLSRVRSIDLLDFDEDIQNITEFLRSQNSPSLREQEEMQAAKKSERDIWQREQLKSKEYRQQHRQRRTYPANADSHHHHHNQNHNHHHLHHHHHQHGTPKEIFSPDSIINEISKHIEHLQYLPDTEENRKMIAEFFDDLDHRIESSRNEHLNFNQKFSSLPNSYRPIPILGY